MGLSPLEQALRWLPLAAAVMTACLAYVAFELVRLTGLRRFRQAAATQELHWTERARLGFPTRAQSSALLVLLLLGAVLGPLFLSTGPLSATPAWFNATLTAFLTAAASLLALRRLGQELALRPTRIADDVRAFLFLIRGWLIGLFWVVGLNLLGTAVFEEQDFAAYLAALLTLAVPHLVLPALFRWVRLWVPDEDLARRLQPLFDRAQMKPRRVDRLELSMANAFAFPLSRTLAVTRGLLEELDPEELEAVVAHELGHLREGARALVRFVPFLGVAFWSFFQPLEADPLLYVALYFGSLPVLILLTRRLSQSLEHRADHAATELADGAVYARALEKVHEQNFIPAVLSKSATHPSLYDRMLGAGVTPSYPRPAPPPRANPLPLFLGLVVGGAAPALGTLVPLALEAPEHDGIVAALSSHEGPSALNRLGTEKFHEGKQEAAIALYRLAAERAPDSPWHAMNLAFTLNHGGHCAEAQSELERAWDLSKNDESVLEHLPDSLPCGSRGGTFGRETRSSHRGTTELRSD